MALISLNGFGVRVRRVKDSDQSVGAAREKILGLQGAVGDGVNRAFKEMSVLEIQRK